MLPPPGTPGTDLPVRTALPALTDALAAAGSAVLVAPPGTGKTTLVPLALAGTVPGRVLVAEPRRVAARAAARRMAGLLGEAVGSRVGYSVRGESRRSAATRVEVVTTGLLVRRLQADPELPGVDAVLLDECHERHLDTDLALAFGLDVRGALRPDLRLLAMSATAQADRLAALLGNGAPAPVVRAPGALHDVDVVWAPPPTAVDPPHGLRVDPRLLAHVAATVRRALAERDGDVLVFLPGAGEIGTVTGQLGGIDADVLPLHGRLPAAAQDAALRPGPRRRVVLATALAESSLTVPGVRVVVDAGLSRAPRADLSRGLGSLVTVRASRASVTQRAGRAGREAPGAVYRCWTAAEQDRLPAHEEPEVATADLTAFALELACWGAPGGHGLGLPDAPPAAALLVADQTLRALGAVDGDGRATSRGRALTAVGVHPRLARALLDGAPLVGSRRAAEVVALLSADVASRGDDLTATWRHLRSGADRGASARWREEVARLERATGDAAPPGLPDDTAAGLVVGLAHPERLARRRPGTSGTYLMAAGTGAELAPGTALTGAPWLAVAVADRSPGRRDARVRSAVAIDEATALEAGGALHEERDEVAWRDGDVRSSHVERLGAIVLAERPSGEPDPAAVASAVAEGLRREGLGLLRWTPAARRLRERLAAARSGLGAPWPAVDDDALLTAIDVSGARSRADLARVDVVAALRGLVPWQVSGELDAVVPDSVTVPTGSRIRIDYTDPDVPTLSVRVQEVFGWSHAPRVAGRPLRLQLLSPAQRPVATTADLAGFWTTGYPAVRSELRGRYPRHPWPEDPATAVATKRATSRARSRD
ncbi:ATP-dependent helicase HrpB [Blastococcus saxobsidens]|uniref:ATP-dependent helicase HrpB n=1 Tax=Blastococcus saxobsidens TaxID=138336 RepID=A0A4V2G230_9ACTN|nr:ATP-dependent helicase HrpB [Blastococcus saxobsidens]RZU31526.1 ATP-dependent helicase HrpB [Blastococcus saxobsidens]